MSTPEPDELKRQLLLDAIESLLPLLDDLLGEQAAGWLAAVESLLPKARAGDGRAYSQLLMTVRGDETIRKWLRRVQEMGGRTKAVQRGQGSLLPGRPSPMGRPQFACPEAECAFVWFQRVAGMQPPPCPLHGRPVVRVDERQAPP